MEMWGLFLSPSESDELSQQPSSATASATQELVSHLLSGPVSSAPALVSEKTTVSTTSAPQLSENDRNTIIENLFSPAQIDKMHNFHKCRSTGCNGISKEELDWVKMSKRRDRFQHEWLFRRETSFCSQTGICWLVYVENEGMYCLLCRKHKSKSAQIEARHSLMIHPQSSSWMQSQNTSCAKHQTTVKNELLNRVSHFQKQVDEKESTIVLCNTCGAWDR